MAWKPTDEIHTRTKRELLADIKIALASRASEEIFPGPGQEMAGASGGLASATHIAEQIVNLFGMNGSLTSNGGAMDGTNFLGDVAGGPSASIDYLAHSEFHARQTVTPRTP